MKIGTYLQQAHVRAPDAYKGYVLGLLTLVLGLTYADRFLMTLLLQPIKEDLHLSDTQLGFLTGIAFGLFYATLGLPIARWADRGNRVTIASIAIGLWALTVMTGPFVANFIQLAFMRIAAGIGESGCMPPTYSLLGDYYLEPDRRTRAMTIYWLAAPVAGLLSFAFGGWLNDLYGWRMAFFIVGIPGLLAAVIVNWTVLEPRAPSIRARSSRPIPPPIAQVFRTLWRQRSSMNLSVAVVLLFTVGQGLTPWYAAFLVRSHGMQTAELGIWLGLIFSVAGTTGTLLGGYVAARWFANNEWGQMRVTAFVIASLVPCFAAFLLAPQTTQTLIALVPLVIAFNFFVGPTFALMQRLMPNDMRATTLAVVMLFANLIGMGLAPQVVGMLSDYLRPDLGADSLRYSMLIMSLVSFWAAYHFWQVGRTVTEDLLARLPNPGQLQLDQ